MHAIQMEEIFFEDWNVFKKYSALFSFTDQLFFPQIPFLLFNICYLGLYKLLWMINPSYAIMLFCITNIEMFVFITYFNVLILEFSWITWVVLLFVLYHFTNFWIGVFDELYLQVDKIPVDNISQEYY